MRIVRIIIAFTHYICVSILCDILLHQHSRSNHHSLSKHFGSYRLERSLVQRIRSVTTNFVLQSVFVFYTDPAKCCVTAVNLLTYIIFITIEWLPAQELNAVYQFGSS